MTTKRVKISKDDFKDLPLEVTVKKGLRLVGYNCAVCHGANFGESGDVITHICSGFAEPIYE